jgi:hypothetical protein
MFVSLGVPLFYLAFEVGGGLGIVRDADHDDAPQCAVRLAVTAAIEAVPVALARRGRDGSHPAQMGSSGL